MLILHRSSNSLKCHTIPEKKPEITYEDIQKIALNRSLTLTLK